MRPLSSAPRRRRQLSSNVRQHKRCTAGGRELVQARRGRRPTGGTEAESTAVSTTYDEAKKPGGKHHGLLRLLSELGPRQRRKAAESYEDQVELHLDKIAAPQKYVEDWDDLSDSHKAALIRNWRREVEDRREQMAILKGYEDENC